MADKIDLDVNAIADLDKEVIDTGRTIHRKGHKSIYLAGTVAAGGGYVIGFDAGCISGTMVQQPFIDRFLNVDFTYREALLVSLMLVTSTIGGVGGGSVCDYIGRRNAILVGAGLFSLGALFMTIGVNFGVFITGRLIAGFGQGLLACAVPLYHSEIAPPHIRGRLITIFSAMSSVGTVVGYFINFGTSYLTSDWSWRAGCLIELVSCLFLLLAYVLPYSPRWLVDKDRHEEALNVVAKLHESTIDDPDVRYEYQTICQEIEREKAYGARTYIECFRGTNLKRTLMGIFTGEGSAFTGTYSINYYLPQVFAQAGIGGTAVSLATSGASNILVVLATVLTIWIIDSVGRRPIFISGAIIMGITMYIVGGLFQAYYVLDDSGSMVGLSNHGASIVTIVLVFIFQATYAFSWGPVGFVYPAEIANMRTRAMVTAMASGLNWGVGIFMSFVMPIFMANTIYGPYYFFGACCTVLLVITIFFLPETKNKTLEEIDRMFNPE